MHSARALKLADTGFVVFAQSGPRWYKAEVRGWYKDRIFIKVPDSFCNGDHIAELNRRELWAKRYTAYDGITYFTPDGKDREDAQNAKTIAAGQMTAEVFIYCFAFEGSGPGKWYKQRVHNMNARWVFFYWDGCSDIEYVERDGLDSDRGSMGDPSCCIFFSEACSSRQGRERRSIRSGASP